MTVGMDKSGNILENCINDLENADVHGTNYYSCIFYFST